MRSEIIGNATLYCGDCMEILPTLPRSAAVLTDPPYGVLDEVWDDMGAKVLARFTMQWLSLAAANSDVLVTFFGEQTRAVMAPLLEMLYPEVRQLIWNKTGGEVARHRFFYAFESIYLCTQGETWEEWEVCEPKSMEVATLITAARQAAGLSKGGVDMLVRGKKTGLCYRWEEAACLPTPEQIAKLRQHMALGPEFDEAIKAAEAIKRETIESARTTLSKKSTEKAAKYADVFTFSPPAKKRHPCEKPVPLLERLIDALDGETICDPFMGSGTTGVACANLGRKFVGIEREPKYFDLACERIASAQSQQRLFA
jgi:hypothetical protein